MNDITFIILKAVVAVAVALITTYLVPVLKQIKEDSQNKAVYDAIETAVKAAEQTIKGSGQGTAKKEQVVKRVTTYLNEKGITISEDQLNDLIEESVYLLNNPQS
jgi:LL-H family phage holin